MRFPCNPLRPLLRGAFWIGLCALSCAGPVRPVVSAESGSPASGGRTEDEEIRGLWVTRWDYRKPEDVRLVMRNAASCGFNRIYFQVRGEATAFYRSSHEPWAWELTGKDPSTTGKDPGWDPLALAVEEARKHGMELHAYVNVLPAWKHPQDPPRNSGHVYVAHPEWIMVSKSGERMTPRNQDLFYAFLNPALPEVRAHLVRVFAEIARRYPDLDGIHYDYIRYPGERGDYSHDAASREAFRAFSEGKTPAGDPALWRRWRGAQINRLLAELRNAILAENPDLEISAAVTKDYREAVEMNGQFSLGWLERGYVDTLMPMLYDYDDARFRRFAATFLGEARPEKGRVVAGLYPNSAWRRKGDYTRDTLVRQTAFVRALGADGVCIFAYEELFPGHQAGSWAAFMRDKRLFGAE